MNPQNTDLKRVATSISPVVGAGLTIAGWVVVANVGWQVMSGLTQAMLCEARSRRPMECQPAWSQMDEIGRRSTETLLYLVIHSPAESLAAALGTGSVMIQRRRQNVTALNGPIGIVPSSETGNDRSDDPEPA